MVNNISKEDVINKIVEIIKIPFEEKGFSLKRKRFFEREDSNGNLLQYEINLSKAKGYFGLHLMLRILNKPMLKKVNVFLKQALQDEMYYFPENWSENDVREVIKGRVGSYTLAGLTDWNEFKKENESWEEFQKNFKIWMCWFDEIEEIANWEKQLLKSIDYAEEWFSVTAKDNEWIINNTLYPALYLLKEEKRFDELNQKYAEFTSQSFRNVEEIKLFYKYLMSS